MKLPLYFLLLFGLSLNSTAQSKRDRKEAENLANKGRFANSPAESHRYFLEAWELVQYTNMDYAYPVCNMFLRDINTTKSYRYPPSYVYRLEKAIQPMILKEPGEGNYYMALAYAWYFTVKDSGDLARSYYNKALKSKSVDGYSLNYMAEIFNPALAEANRRKAAELDSIEKVMKASKAPTPETDAANDIVVKQCWKELEKELGKISATELAGAASDIAAANRCIKENNNYCLNLNVNSAISNLAVAKEFVNFARRIVGNHSNRLVNPSPRHNQEMSAMRSNLSAWEKSIADKIKELKSGRKQAIQNMALKDLYDIHKSYF